MTEENAKDRVRSRQTLLWKPLRRQLEEEEEALLCFKAFTLKYKAFLGECCCELVLYKQN